MNADGTIDESEARLLRQEIRETRAELGATVQVLAARADVMARAQQALQEQTSRVRATARDTIRRVTRTGRGLAEPPMRWILATAAGVLGVLAALAAARRRR